MELGNLLFGHNSQAIPVDRDGDAAERLLRILRLYGFDDYGQVDGPSDDFPVRLTEGAYWRETLAGEHVIVRVYGWDEDDPHLYDPNMEIDLGDGTFKLAWYKYAFRDTYANMPLDGTIGRIEAALADELERLSGYWRARIGHVGFVDFDGDTAVVHVARIPVGWTITPACREEDGSLTLNGGFHHVPSGWVSVAPLRRNQALTVERVVHALNGPHVEPTLKPMAAWTMREEHVPGPKRDGTALERLDYLTRHIVWQV